MPALQELRLTWTEVTDKGLASANLPALRLLYLDHHWNNGDSNMALVRRFPGVRVEIG